jgi:hypothetical protein
MLVNDIRFAIRALARSRTFTISALATLALGISVNTAIFSVIDSVLLTPPPFDAPERIVAIEGQNKAQGLEGSSVAYPDVLDWRTDAHGFEAIAIYRNQTFNIAGDDRAERASGARVSANYFRVRRQATAAFVPAGGGDVRHGARDRAERRVLASSFAASPAIIGTSLLINGWQYTVVGVMPKGSPTRRVLKRGRRSRRLAGDASRQPVRSRRGRLSATASVQQGTTELNAIAKRLEQTYPGSNTGGA